ncbi:hypothetical protein M3Y97_00911500 [Aphelenchoides bicaudatus]|nr:hypothetical protein M3Y97_00911500 [Aphelenchoides bicaudatus]
MCLVLCLCFLLFITAASGLRKSKEQQKDEYEDLCDPELEIIENNPFTLDDYKQLFLNKTTGNLVRTLLARGLFEAASEQIGIEELRANLDKRFQGLLTDKLLFHEERKLCFMDPAFLRSLDELGELVCYLNHRSFSKTWYSSHMLFTDEEIKCITAFVESKFKEFRQCFHKHYQTVKSKQWENFSKENMELGVAFERAKRQIKDSLEFWRSYPSYHSDK